MKASALEFRLRYLLHAIVIALGFWAPWTYLHAGNQVELANANTHVWGILAANLAQLFGPQTGAGNILTAFNALLLAAIFLATLAAFLRTWGSAYLGNDIVQDGAMHTAVDPRSSGILQDGPFRHLRNPLYLGTFLHVLAISILMPRSGAIFAIVLIGLMQIRLILGEEAFLNAKLGEPYRAYCSMVPRLIPSLRPRVTSTGEPPRWPQAFLGEVYMWIVAASFAFAGWRYNASLLTQCVLVAFGVSLLTRALKPVAKA